MFNNFFVTKTFNLIQLLFILLLLFSLSSIIAFDFALVFVLSPLFIFKISKKKSKLSHNSLKNCIQFFNFEFSHIYHILVIYYSITIEKLISLIKIIRKKK